MNKISKERDLISEKRMLTFEKQQLESELKVRWNVLKESLDPVDITKSKLQDLVFAATKKNELSTKKGIRMRLYQFFSWALRNLQRG
jgi:hypothetical protein